jgi:very-short-patch-repair endonuclease
MQADKSNYWGYNKNLQRYANDLRHRMTRGEATLWKYVLRASQAKGYPFRRQRPVLTYIADFLSKDLNLIIEVDGLSHSSSEQQARDVVRQKALEEAGFVVIRFTDEEVIDKIEFVAKEIERTIEVIEKERQIHPPGPRQREK